MTDAKRIEARKRHRQSAQKTPEALSWISGGLKQTAASKLQPIKNLAENKGQRSQNVPRRQSASASGVRHVHKNTRPDASEKPQLLSSNETLCRKSMKRHESRCKPPSGYIQDRVAKKFDGVTYFGTITCIKRKNNVAYWHVNYDDGDSEDFDNMDLCKAIELYKRRQAGDPEQSQHKRNSSTNSPQNTIVKGPSALKKNHPEPASAKVSQRFTKPTAKTPKKRNCDTIVSSVPTLGQVPRKKKSTEVSPASSSGRLSSAAARGSPCIPAAPTTQLLRPCRTQNQPSFAIASSALAGRKTSAFGKINAAGLVKEMTSTLATSVNKSKITRKQKGHCFVTLIQMMQLEKKKEQRNLGANDSHNNSTRYRNNGMSGKETSFEGRHYQLPQEPQFHNGNFPSSHESNKNALASTGDLVAGGYRLCQTAMSESCDVSRKSVDLGCAVTPPNTSAGRGTCENGDGAQSRQ